MSAVGTPSVRINVATKDLFHYWAHLERRRFGRLGQQLLLRAPPVLVIIAVVLPRLTGDRAHLPDGFQEILVGLAAVLLVVALAGPFVLHQRRSFARRPTDYDLTPSGLDWRNDVSQGLTRWDRIAGIEETGDLCLFRLRGLTAHIIPKRAFDAPEAAQRFLDTARNYWQAARQGL